METRSSCSYTILSLSRDVALLASRNAVLRQAGYNVVTTTKDDEAFAILRENSVDAVVLGDSFAPIERNRFVCAIQAINPKTQVLVIKLSSESAPEGCISMDSLDGPETLLAKLRQASLSTDAQAA